FRLQYRPMSRDPRKLKVFGLADELVVEVYRRTRDFPVEEALRAASADASKCRIGTDQYRRGLRSQVHARLCALSDYGAGLRFGSALPRRAVESTRVSASWRPQTARAAVW